MLPVIDGVIERRLLVNYRVDADVARALLPHPFRPHLVDGFAVAGICLLRMGSLRPRGLPAALGRRSENAAHRIAVDWDDETGLRTGVYIPRRDSGSWLNVAAGGRLFPGEHGRARFDVTETPHRLQVAFSSVDARAHAAVDVAPTRQFSSRVFADLATASTFFRSGSVGWSATRHAGAYDGLELRTDDWSVQPAEVAAVSSSYFSDRSSFPEGSAELDCVLVMRDVPVSWHPLPRLSPTRASQPA